MLGQNTQHPELKEHRFTWLIVRVGSAQMWLVSRQKHMMGRHGRGQLFIQVSAREKLKKEHAFSDCTQWPPLQPGLPPNSTQSQFMDEPLTSIVLHEPINFQIPETLGDILDLTTRATKKIQIRNYKKVRRYTLTYKSQEFPIYQQWTSGGWN